uniref:Uncharacterized protein n=1 Tax=Rhodopseudomonas palustris (strain ATCC BAA-98 / CGA009) TaxID=258594 RepID=Q6N4G7_RHOPA|nr:hypothetical protein RPA3370 [Rhodopseudomonas palustris CGA009]
MPSRLDRHQHRVRAVPSECDRRCPVTDRRPPHWSCSERLRSFSARYTPPDAAHASPRLDPSQPITTGAAWRRFCFRASPIAWLALLGIQCREASAAAIRPWMTTPSQITKVDSPAAATTSKSVSLIGSVLRKDGRGSPVIATASAASHPRRRNLRDYCCTARAGFDAGQPRRRQAFQRSQPPYQDGEIDRTGPQQCQGEAERSAIDAGFQDRRHVGTRCHDRTIG